MRLSEYFLQTLREDPAEAEVVSHKLMLRAGMMKKLAAGVYVFLPLGFRVLKKVETIVREEMDKAGAQELLMPALSPRELWEETGRWQIYGPELMRLKDRHDRDFCLGPTHEEIITHIVRTQIRSYRQLPVILYQIQTKFRDEIRPRFGMIRAREFVMKDAYSFERKEEELEENYKKMYEAYCRIFKRCGLKFRAVEAFTGAIGGKASHEFLVLADTGEEALLYCDTCSYAANLERACGKEPGVSQKEKELALEKVKTPGKKSVEEVSSFLKVATSRLVKTLIFSCNGQAVAALVRGDQDMNMAKLQNVLGENNVTFSDKAMIERVTGAPVGFAGPVGLKEKPVKIVADRQVALMQNFVVGANETDAHFINVNAQRDFQFDEAADIRVAKENDRCESCGKGNLKLQRGIEVGHVFKLGRRYSDPMKATFLDENGKEKSMFMGCYGIGVSRIVAAAIEQDHDASGVIWPPSLAPFQALVCPLGEHEMSAAQEIVLKLEQSGMDTLLDDRDERPGVKFKDADLIGIPVQVILGKSMKEGRVEIKVRKTGEKEFVEIENTVDAVKRKLDELSSV